MASEKTIILDLDNLERMKSDEKKQLKNITIKKGTEYIERDAFKDCTNLTEVKIPSTAISISVNAFDECNKLKSIHVSPNNKNYSDKDGVLFDKSGKVLYKCPNGYSGDYAIPEGVQVIYPYAFHHCKKLRSVSIPASLDCWLGFYERQFISNDQLKERFSFFCPKTLTPYPLAFEDYPTRALKLKYDGGECGVVVVPMKRYATVVYHSSTSERADRGDGFEEYVCRRDDIFHYCDALEEINVDPRNKCLWSKDGILFIRTGLSGESILESYPSAKKDSSFTFPPDVTAFSLTLQEARYLKELIIPVGSKMKPPCPQPYLNEIPYIRSITLDEKWKTDEEWLKKVKASNITVNYLKNKKFRLKNNLSKTGELLLTLICLALLVAVVVFAIWFTKKFGLVSLIGMVVILILLIIFITSL